MKISRKTKNQLTKIFNIVLAVITLIGAVALVNHFVSNKADDDGLVKVYPIFEVGGLDDSTGTRKSLLSFNTFDDEI